MKRVLFTIPIIKRIKICDEFKTVIHTFRKFSVCLYMWHGVSETNPNALTWTTTENSVFPKSILDLKPREKFIKFCFPIAEWVKLNFRLVSHSTGPFILNMLTSVESEWEIERERDWEREIERESTCVL